MLQHDTPINPLVENDYSIKYPACAAVRLSAADWVELERQRSVAAERRGVRTYFKLRFRRQGLQIVRGLGTDAQMAAKIRAELVQLQSTVRQLRALKVLTDEAKQTLRDAKAKLTPLLAERGIHFHGLAVRKSRGLLYETNLKL